MSGFCLLWGQKQQRLTQDTSNRDMDVTPWSFLWPAGQEKILGGSGLRSMPNWARTDVDPTGYREYSTFRASDTDYTHGAIVPCTAHRDEKCRIPGVLKPHARNCSCRAPRSTDKLELVESVVSMPTGKSSITRDNTSARVRNMVLRAIADSNAGQFLLLRHRPATGCLKRRRPGAALQAQNGGGGAFVPLRRLHFCWSGKIWPRSMTRLLLLII